jgi:xylulokinase
MPAENFWRAFVTAVQGIAAEVSRDPIDALAISSHGETFIPVDRQQQALAPAILNFDNRAVMEAKWLGEALGQRRIFDLTGLSIHPMYPLAKILWLRKHQPELFASTACFLALPDYLRTRLGLSARIDYSLASRFLAFDIRDHSWSAETLSACQLSPEQLPAPVPAGSIAGELSTGAARALGLRAGTLVVVGGHDQPCGSLGSGVLDPGRVSASLGTYECLTAASDSPALGDRAFAANLNSYCHVVPERYVTLAYFPSGLMLDWYLHILDSREGAGIWPSVAELCGRLEAEAPSGSSGLCITPHLSGTCNPDFNPDASGVISGLRPSTNRANIYKGILEGIACEFANMAEMLRNAAGGFEAVYISGGGVRSPLGLKLRAALAGTELRLMECQEATCLGTAILAGIAAEKYGSFAEAVEQVVHVSEVISPDMTMAESYKAQMLQYRLLYASLAPVRRAQGSCN